jgi:hypothetical protein
MDRPTLKNQGGVETAELHFLEDQGSKPVVRVKGMIFFSPGVKPPINSPPFSLGIQDKRRPIIPNPGIIVV